MIIGYYLDDPYGGPVPGEIARLHAALRNTPGWRRWLRRRWRLFYWWEHWRWSRRLREAQIRFIREIYDSNRPLWQRHRQVLAQLKQACQAHQTPCWVLIWTHLGFPLDARYPFLAVHAQIRRTLHDLGIAWVDLLEVFWGMDHHRLQAVPALDPHPSEVAHRLAAEFLFDRLRKDFPSIRTDIDPQRVIPNAPIPSLRLRLQPLEF